MFRIASISKTITAVGVMKLVEEGKVSLEDRVFGLQGNAWIVLPHKTNPYTIKTPLLQAVFFQRFQPSQLKKREVLGAA